MKVLALAVLLVVPACVVLPYSPGPVSITLAGGEDGRITFVSEDPYDFPDMISGAGPDRIVHGDLILPDGDGEVRGTAILSHGSGGTGARQDRMAETLVKAGYAAFIMDHFAPREIGSTVADQLKVTAQTMMADVFAAQDLLATHPRIDKNRIGVIGWSKGAITAALSAVDRVAGYADGGADRMAFAIAFYPFCGWDLDAETLASPTLYLMGSEDDWTPAAPCVRQAEVWQAAEQPIAWEVYDGARHGFDSRSPDFTIGRAITVRDVTPKCTLVVTLEGRTQTVDGAQHLSSIEARKAYLDVCGERGVGFGGDPVAREASRSRVLQFLDTVLAP
ncbi:MAG: dienelactone hydrolase family protein [Paracoccaceae bacterium]